MNKVNMRLPLVFLVALFFIAIGGSAVFAQTDQHILDNARLLTEAEAAELEAFAAQHSQEEGVDFLFLTTPSTDGQSIEAYMGDFFDQWAAENNQENAVLLTRGGYRRRARAPGGLLQARSAAPALR